MLLFNQARLTSGGVVLAFFFCKEIISCFIIKKGEYPCYKIYRNGAYDRRRYILGVGLRSYINNGVSIK